MKTSFLLSVLLAGALSLQTAAQDAATPDATEPVLAPAPRPEPAKPNPERFAMQIGQFEERDAKGFVPKGAIVMTGSSSMRGWHGRMREDLAPLSLLPRGFGGSTIFDLDHYLDRIVLKYEPRAVVIYEGDNDLTQGFKAETVLEAMQGVVARLHAADPAVRVYFLATKPSPSRARIWPEMQRHNALLKAYCDATANVTFIDVATPMLDAEGGFREDLYIKDRLHLSGAGYDIWRDAVRAVLVPAEEAHER